MTGNGIRLGTLIFLTLSRLGKLQKKKIADREKRLFLILMTTTRDQIKADLKRLSNEGVNLFNAMLVEQFTEKMESHFTLVLKKDYQAFLKTLPVFAQEYQIWYSSA